MSKYTTEQRRKLISFLRENPHKLFTAKEISEQLQDAQISISAVYRNLSALEASGYISRVIRENSREVCYQSIDSESCRNSIHLNCIKCGKTFHMNPKETEHMTKSVFKWDNFEIDKGKTVLYGTCKHCI